MFHDVYADIQCDTLENGLSVYSKEWPNVSWLYTGMIIHAGAREDPPRREGLAHLVEHLVGENIDGLTFPQLERTFKTLGGYAWFGATSYLASEYAFHLPNDPSKMYQALHLFGQMLLLPKELSHHIEEEKAVILREYHRDYEHEQDRSWTLQGRPWLFEYHHRLQSYHTAIGTPDGFLSCTKQDIQGFYDGYYVPQNCSVMCIGALERQTLLSLLQDTPLAIQRAAGQRNLFPEPFSPQVPQKHEHIVHLSDISRLEQWEAEISFEWVLPLCFERKCVQMFCGLFEEVLTAELRYRMHLNYSVTVHSTYYQDCRTLSASFQTAPDAIEKTQALFWQTLRSIEQEEERYREIKRERLASIYRMDYSGHDLLESAMDDLVEYQRLIPFGEELQQIQNITFEQIMELARYLTDERHFCFILQL